MKNFEKYKALTHQRDWAGIFALNNLNIDSFGTKKELSVLGMVSKIASAARHRRTSSSAGTLM